MFGWNLGFAAIGVTRWFSLSRATTIPVILAMLPWLGAPTVTHAYSPSTQLQVSVISAQGGEALAGVKLRALELLQDGRRKLRGTQITNKRGLAQFSLPGLGEGVRFVVTAEPYGGRVQSAIIENPGPVTLRVGQLEALLTQGDKSRPLPNQEVRLTEQLDDGNTKTVATGRTNSAGVVRFDPPSFESGHQYLLQTTDTASGHLFSSLLIQQPGRFRFPVGSTRLNVAVQNAISGEPLVNLPVQMRGTADSRFRGLTQTKRTDAKGNVQFNLIGLGSGQAYQLIARPYGSKVTSDPINAPGDFLFKVGTVGVTLLDQKSNAPLSGRRLLALQQMADGKLRERQSNMTDDAGIAYFDLGNFGKGETFVFRAINPFRDGKDYLSPQLTQPGSLVFAIGDGPQPPPPADQTPPVVSIQQPLDTIVAAEGGFTASGSASDDGGIRNVVIAVVHADDTSTTFDASYDEQAKSWTASIPGSAVQGGETITLRATATDTANNQATDMRTIKVTAPDPGDKTAPTISITQPGDSATVPADGFDVKGTATDNKGVREVTLVITDPRAGANTVAARYDATTNEWSASVGANQLSAGESVSLLARAIDTSGNESTASRTVKIAAASNTVQISVESHRDNDSVPAAGFTLTGRVTGANADSELYLSLQDPVLGTPIQNRRIALGADGAWSSDVGSNDITAGQTVTVTLSVKEGNNDLATATLRLSVAGAPNSDATALHLLNRVTFGATPALLTHVTTVGQDAFINEQLNPDGIDDSAFESSIGNFTPSNQEELETYQARYATFTKRQLREVMTVFWDNHFSTFYSSHGNVGYELDENKAFRSNALGKFRDLLGISAKSPAMLVYLNSNSNVKGAPNENYAREVMELHSLGVDGGYTQADVENVARAFTGWRVRSGAFSFDAARHDTDAKTVLGQTIAAGGGIEDGERVLDILANHTSTARFVCTKLARVFVTDAPPSALVNRCADTFRNATSDADQMGQVVRSLLTSGEFGASGNRLAKVKTPLEFVVGTARNFDVSGDGSDLAQVIRNLGMPLFDKASPDGYAEVGEPWVSSQLLLGRMKWANTLALRAVSTDKSTIDVLAFVRASGAQTAEQVVDYLLDYLVGNNFTTLERDTAVNILTDGGTTNFDINANGAEAKLRRLLGTVLSYPAYQLQ